MSETIAKAKSEGRDSLRIVSWSAGRGAGLTQMTPTLHLKWQKRTNLIFERALSYQRIKDLYLEAMLAPYPKTGETGPWKLWLVSKDDRAYPNLVACCSLEYRSIIINVDQSDDEILSCLVFELTNAASSRHIEQFEQEVGKGKVSREDYAKAVEKIEHEGAMRHHAIMKHAVTEMGWDPSLDRFKDFLKDFEKFWAENKNSQHVENSRSRWDLFVKEDYKASK